MKSLFTFLCAALALLSFSAPAFAHGEAQHPHIASHIFTEVHDSILERDGDGRVVGIEFTGTSPGHGTERVRVQRGEHSGLTVRDGVLILTVSEMTIWNTCADRGMPEYASVHEFYDENMHMIDAVASVYVGLNPCD